MIFIFFDQTGKRHAGDLDIQGDLLPEKAEKGGFR
jgi:hypothetical protein